MLCDICKKNQATVHITKIINGDKQELSICDLCAKDIDGFNAIGDIEFVSPFSFQNILSGLIDYVNQSSITVKNNEMKCDNCGTTYNEFKEKGLLGCSKCYEKFKATVMPVINSVQGNSDHVGKIPKKCGKYIIEKNRMLELKNMLKEAITKEEYEKAAEIRDQIRGIKDLEREV